MLVYDFLTGFFKNSIFKTHGINPTHNRQPNSIQSIFCKQLSTKIQIHPQPKTIHNPIFAPRCCIHVVTHIANRKPTQHIINAGCNAASFCMQCISSPYIRYGSWLPTMQHSSRSLCGYTTSIYTEFYSTINKFLNFELRILWKGKVTMSVILLILMLACWTCWTETNSSPDDGSLSAVESES